MNVRAEVYNSQQMERFVMWSIKVNKNPNDIIKTNVLDTRRLSLVS